MARSILGMGHKWMSIWGGVFIHGFNYAVKCHTVEALMLMQLC